MEAWGSLSISTKFCTHIVCERKRNHGLKGFVLKSNELHFSTQIIGFPLRNTILNWRVVYSKELQWLENGSEWPPDATKKFTAFSSNQKDLRGMAEAPPKSHYDDIVLAKLRPGQVRQGGALGESG